MMEYLIPFVAREKERKSKTLSWEEELGKPQAIIYLSHLYGLTWQINRPVSRFKRFRSSEWCGGNLFPPTIELSRSAERSVTHDDGIWTQL